MMLYLGIGLRPMRLGDSHHLINIDLKSSEIPWDVEDWQLLNNYFQHWRVNVGLFREVPSAFSVAEVDKEDDVLRIHKLESLPAVRRVGLNLLMIDALQHEATMDGVESIEFFVPECSCRGPNDPYDMSGWLLGAGFKCEGEFPEMFEGYGNLYSGFMFRKSVSYGK